LQPASAEVQPLPTLHVNAGHSDASGHELPPMHLTSQAHEVEHFVRRWHEYVPLHVTEQSPGPHWISSPHDE
jgi:hypothetical protein